MNSKVQLTVNGEQHRIGAADEAPAGCTA